MRQRSWNSGWRAWDAAARVEGLRIASPKLRAHSSTRFCRRASSGHQTKVVHWLRGRHEQERREEEPPSGIPFWGGRPRLRTATVV